MSKGIYEIAKKNGVKVSLAEFNLRQEDIDKAVNLIMEKNYPNPKQLTRENVTELLTKAWKGEL